MNLSSVGTLLQGAWRAYTANLLTLVGIFAVPVVFMIGTLLLGGFALLVSPFAFDFTAAAMGMFFAIFLLWLVAFFGISSWASVAAIHVAKARQESVGIREAYRRGRPLIFSYIWVSLLVGLASLGGFLLGLMLFSAPGLIAVVLNLDPSLLWLFVPVGILGGLIPFIIISVWLSLSPYVLVGEGKKGMSALKRSKELVSGIWWRMALRLLVVAVVAVAANIVFTIIFFFLPVDLSSLMQTLFVTPFTVMFLYLLYENIRNARESLSV